MVFTELVVFRGVGWTLVAFDSICGIYGALVLYVWHLGFVSPLYASSCSA